jgi:hypothetical protein
LREESFDFLAGYCEVLIDHFLEIGSFLIGGMEVLADYHSHLLQGDHIVRALVLLMMPDTALHLAYSGPVRTGETTTQLYHATAVDVAESLLVFGVAE